MAESTLTQPDTEAEYGWNEVRQEYGEWHNDLRPHVERLLAEYATPDVEVVETPSPAPEEPPSVHDIVWNLIESESQYKNGLEDAGSPYEDDPDYVIKRPGLAEYNIIRDAGETDDAGEPYADKPYLFSGLDKATVLRLVAEDKAPKVAIGIREDSFESLDMEVARELIAHRGTSAVAENLDSFTDLDYQQLADQILASGNGLALALNLPKFYGVDPQYVANKLISREQYGVIAAGLNNFPDVDQQWLLDTAIHRKRAGYLANFVSNFTQLDRHQLLTRLCSEGYATTLINQGKGGSLNDEDRRALAFTVCDDEKMFPTRIDFTKFSGLSIEQPIAERLLKEHAIEFIPEAWQGSFSFTSEQLRAVESQYVGVDDATFGLYVREVGKLRPTDRPRATGEAMRLFGEYITEGAALLIHDVLGGTVSEGATAVFGIREPGEAGLEELEQAIEAFTAEIYSGELSDETLDKLEMERTIDQLDKSQVLLALLRKTTRYGESEWGHNTDYELMNIIEQHRLAKADGITENLSAAYQPSDVIEVSKLKAQKEKSLWTEDLLARYDMLYTELQEANLAMSHRRPFSKLFDELRDQVRDMVYGMDDKLATTDLNPKARESIERRRDELLALITSPNPDRPQNYPLRSLANFEQNFRMLATNNALHPTMRKLVFAWALRQRKEWQPVIAGLSKDPEIEDVSQVREFVEHIVNKETFHGYFQDKKSARLFSGMTSAKALEEGMLRLQGVGVSNDKIPIEFIPTRGILMELSGQISDACWASKYDSIAREKPNMTAVIMKQHPGDAARKKLIGAGMLIETSSGVGEPILLIRGLNPLENFINQVSAEEFYNGFIDYARKIAEARGRQLAIVIDGQSGGATTNRPALYAYVASKRNSLQRVQVNGADTEFNGYNVTNNAYLV